METTIVQLRASNERMEKQLSDIQNILIQNKETVRLLVQAAQGAGRTRALFLSATPFAYEKTISCFCSFCDYCLFVFKYTVCGFSGFVNAFILLPRPFVVDFFSKRKAY